MNNTFNIRRFGFVFRKDFMENQKRYALLFLTMLGMMAIVITMISWEYYYELHPAQVSYYYHNKNLLILLSFAFSGCGILFASTFMTPMNSKLKRLSYLVSPSSNLEKYLSHWMIITIGYILAFFVALWIADTLRVAICSARYPDLDIKFLDLTKLFYPEKSGYKSSEYMVPQSIFIFLTSIYFLFQSVFLLGSTCWEKASFIKTFTAVSVITLAFVLICRWAILLSYGGFNEFGNMLNSFESNFKGIEDQAIIITSVILSVFTLTNWILAFFRLRESEITKRL